jgi:hypothetical protein
VVTSSEMGGMFTPVIFGDASRGVGGVGSDTVRPAFSITGSVAFASAGPEVDMVNVVSVSDSGSFDCGSASTDVAPFNSGTASGDCWSLDSAIASVDMVCVADTGWVAESEEWINPLDVQILLTYTCLNLAGNQQTVWVWASRRRSKIILVRDYLFFVFRAPYLVGIRRIYTRKCMS